MIDTADAIDAALEEAGQAVTYGAQSCFGILDREPINGIVDDEVRVIEERITLNIRHDALNALANDMEITVGGVDFVIRDIGNQQLDGLRELTLVEAD